MDCFVCDNKNLFEFLDLGHQPPSDAFLRKEDLAKPEVIYPLKLYFCERCFLVQLGYVVDPEVLFRDFVYTTGANNSLKANFRSLVDKLVKRFNVLQSDLAVDIGSNDGTLLENYLPYGIKILGIDPSSAAKLAIKKGLPTVIDFFSREVAYETEKKYGKAKIITATNVFAHVGKPAPFIDGVKILLTSDGVFVSESGYLLDFVELAAYDAVYHEHLRYYSLGSLKNFFKRSGLEIFDAERIPVHNGSIRVYAARTGTYQKTMALDELLTIEEKAGLYKKETFIHFADRAKKHALDFQKLLLDLKLAGKKIVGIGAPAKGNTLLNTSHIGKNIVDCLYEKSELKVGMFAPGTHIPVLDESELFTNQPDYAIMLSWNIADELVPKLKKAGYTGKFIIPFPEIKII